MKLAVRVSNAAEKRPVFGVRCSRPTEMSAVWGTIKAQVMFQKWEWEKQSAPLVQSPTIDSWLNPKQSVSIKEAAIALHGIQSALPAALQSGQELLPAAVPMLSESVIDGVEDVEVE